MVEQAVSNNIEDSSQVSDDQLDKTEEKLLRERVETAQQISEAQSEGDTELAQQLLLLLNTLFQAQNEIDDEQKERLMKKLKKAAEVLGGLIY